MQMGPRPLQPGILATKIRASLSPRWTQLSAWRAFLKTFGPEKLYYVQAIYQQEIQFSLVLKAKK